MKILWCAPYYSEYAITTKTSVNIASSVWSHGFVGGLKANGCDVHVVTLCPEQAWPKGRVLWQNNDDKLFDHDVPITSLSYLNIAFVREKWQTLAFVRAVRRLLLQEKFDAFVCYNVLHPYHVSAMKVAKDLGVPAFPIILDAGYDVSKDGLDEMSRCARFADGVVFLSQWCRDNFPSNGRRLLQMEGGVPEWKGKLPTDRKVCDKKIVTYAGAFTTHRGMGLVDMVNSCKRNDVRFILCGKWNIDDAKKVFGNDPRVELRGMVSSSELSRIYAETDVFVNSREASWGHNLANFPSKVLAYLGYGRPIVSNWTVGLPPEYHELLCATKDDTGVAMAAKLTEILDWPLNDRIAWYNKLLCAYQTSKSWKMQAKKFLDFIAEY